MNRTIKRLTDLYPSHDDYFRDFIDERVRNQDSLTRKVARMRLTHIMNHGYGEPSFIQVPMGELR